jgi:FMN reductase (NADPH)
MENPTLDTIHRHASIRHYKPDALPTSLVETIIKAGQRASSSYNLQAYSVVAVTDEGKKSRLAELCGDQEHISEAPLFLAWCADLGRSERFCQHLHYTQISGFVENFLVAAVDAAIAAQNAALAAESLGLGICYIGYIRNNPLEVIELLELPHLVFPITGMTVGLPAKESHPRIRLPLEAVLHWEKYDTSDENEILKKFDEEVIASGLYQSRQTPFPGREEELVNYGWLEHLARRVAKSGRVDVRAALEKQGFLIK